jgi:hypothetical protein
MRSLSIVAVLLSSLCLFAPAGAAVPERIKVEDTDSYIRIDTDALQARIRKKGYVSGVERESFVDKKTGARDLGFGLHIMDFLMAPG